MYFVTEDHILRLHATFDVRAHGMRYSGALTECVEKPQTDFFGYRPYASIYEKAAILLQCIAQQNPFNDGNKRTSLAASFTFLEMNGYVIRITVKKGLAFAVKVAKKEVAFAQIVNWLKTHSHPITYIA